MALLLSVPRSDVCLNLFCLTTVCLLCVKNVCCLTIVMNVNVPAVPSGKTCYVSEFLLPQCCHMNVPAVPSVVPKPVMWHSVRMSVALLLSGECSKYAITCSLTSYVSEFLLPHSCHVNVPTVPSLVSECLLPHCCHMVFQMCHQLFPDLLCVRMSVAPLLSHECSNSAIACSSICYVLSEFLLFTAVWNNVNVAVELILALSLHWISCVTDSWLPHICCKGCFCQDFCLSLTCVWICAAVQLFQIMWMLQQCCHFLVDLICVWSSVAIWLFQIMCISRLCHLFFWGLLYVNLGRCYKGLNITAVPQLLSRSNVCRTFCCITAGWRDVNIMAVPWLLPGYLSESLLPHSYWNGCEHYGCAVLDSPLPHSCCCAITTLCVCCVLKSLLVAEDDLNGVAVLWRLCGSVVFLNFCCLRLLQGMWMLLAVSS